MSNTLYSSPNRVGRPNILYRNDNFLSSDEIKNYQNFLNNNQWALCEGDPFNQLFYISQSLYRHYAWDNDWSSPGWLDSTPMEWEQLYNKISSHLPPHYVHWCDVKMTGSFQGGTPLHRDKDPWTTGGDSDRFSRAITVICNLNTEWKSSWGGGFVVYETKANGDNYEFIPSETIPIVPGQLLIVENCIHSIELITEPARCRTSFILHVLEYKNHDSN